MLFWIVAALLALAVAGLLALAFLRSGAGAEPAAAYDLRVYRDQLKEIDRDLARGIIAPEDAERMKTEVSRRVLEADRALARATATGREEPRAALAVALAITLVAAGGAFLLYQRIGVPGYPDMPLATRIAMAEAALACGATSRRRAAAPRRSAPPA